MQDPTAKLTDKTNNQHKPCKSSDQQTALHLRYGEIGIPAVAAAARYLSGARDAGFLHAVTAPEYRGVATIKSARAYQQKGAEAPFAHYRVTN